MRISDWSSDVCYSDLCKPACGDRQALREREVCRGGTRRRPVDGRLRLHGGVGSRACHARRAWKHDLLRHLRNAAQHHRALAGIVREGHLRARSEEHTSELQSLMRISYAVFCLKKKKHKYKQSYTIIQRR